MLKDNCLYVLTLDSEGFRRCLEVEAISRLICRVSPGGSVECVKNRAGDLASGVAEMQKIVSGDPLGADSPFELALLADRVSQQDRPVPAS